MTVEWVRAPVRVLVLGRPGSGKGTQGSRLARALDVPHISTGDLLRAEMDHGGPLGRDVAASVDRGRMVPDALVGAVLAARLAEPDVQAAGFVLDGYPRSTPQAAALERMLGAQRITVALELMVSEREALHRLRARFVCVDCGHPQGARAAADPERAGVPTCTRCGGGLRRRTDDDPAVIARRFAEFEHCTKPLLEWLDRRHRLVSVDADRPPDTVTRAVLEALAPAVAAVGGPLLAEPELTA